MNVEEILEESRKKTDEKIKQFTKYAACFLFGNMAETVIIYTKLIAVAVYESILNGPGL